MSRYFTVYMSQPSRNLKDRTWEI